jgi:hypothetical protein
MPRSRRVKKETTYGPALWEGSRREEPTILQFEKLAAFLELY